MVGMRLDLTNLKRMRRDDLRLFFLYICDTAKPPVHNALKPLCFRGRRVEDVCHSHAIPWKTLFYYLEIKISYILKIEVRLPENCV